MNCHECDKRCCKNMRIRIFEPERIKLLRIKPNLKMISFGHYHVILSPCPFLIEGKCSIYNQRPLYCRAYPFVPSVHNGISTISAPDFYCSELNSYNWKNFTDSEIGQGIFYTAVCVGFEKFFYDQLELREKNKISLFMKTDKQRIDRIYQKYEKSESTTLHVAMSHFFKEILSVITENPIFAMNYFFREEDSMMQSQFIKYGLEWRNRINSSIIQQNEISKVNNHTKPICPNDGSPSRTHPTGN